MTWKKRNRNKQKTSTDGNLSGWVLDCSIASGGKREAALQKVDAAMKTCTERLVPTEEKRPHCGSLETETPPNDRPIEPVDQPRFPAGRRHVTENRSRRRKRSPCAPIPVERWWSTAHRWLQNKDRLSQLGLNEPLRVLTPIKLVGSRFEPVWNSSKVCFGYGKLYEDEFRKCLNQMWCRIV